MATDAAGGGFVGQDHRGIVDQGTGDGNALLLPAGEMVGREVEASLEARRPSSSAARWRAAWPVMPTRLQGDLDVLERLVKA